MLPGLLDCGPGGEKGKGEGGEGGVRTVEYGVEGGIVRAKGEDEHGEGEDEEVDYHGAVPGG